MVGEQGVVANFGDLGAVELAAAMTRRPRALHEDRHCIVAYLDTEADDVCVTLRYDAIAR